MKRPIADVLDKDVDQMIETLREQKKNWVTVDREAGESDLVNIDYSGRKGGIEFAGGAGKFKKEVCPFLEQMYRLVF